MWGSVARSLNYSVLILATLHDLSSLHSVVSFLNAIQDTHIFAGLLDCFMVAETLQWARRQSRSGEHCVCIGSEAEPISVFMA
jgi:hypothetical protein